MNKTNPFLQNIQELTLKKMPHELTLENCLLSYTKDQLGRLISVLSLDISLYKNKAEIVSELCDYYENNLFCVPNLVIQSKLTFLTQSIINHVPGKLPIERYTLYQQEDVAQLIHHGILFRHNDTFFIPEDRKKLIIKLLTTEDTYLKMARQLIQSAVSSIYVYGTFKNSQLLNLLNKHYPDESYTLTFIEKVLKNVFVHTGNNYEKGILYPDSFFTFNEAKKFIEKQEHGYYLFDKEEVQQYIAYAENPDLVPIYYDLLEILSESVASSTNPDTSISSLFLKELTGTLKRYESIDKVIDRSKELRISFWNDEDLEYFARLFIAYFINMRHWTLGGHRYQDIYVPEKIDKIEDEMHEAHEKKFHVKNNLNDQKALREKYLKKKAKKKKKKRKR